MQATAPSRMVRINGAAMNISMFVHGRVSMALPRRDISRCPAMRFAVSRTHSVTGRMRLLINSISTMKFISRTGVPWGTRWASI